MAAHRDRDRFRRCCSPRGLSISTEALYRRRSGQRGRSRHNGDCCPNWFDHFARDCPRARRHERPAAGCGAGGVDRATRATASIRPRRWDAPSVRAPRTAGRRSLSRGGLLWTPSFPSIAESLRSLGPQVVIHGEAVCQFEDGHSDFHAPARDEGHATACLGHRLISPHPEPARCAHQGSEVADAVRLHVRKVLAKLVQRLAAKNGRSGVSVKIERKRRRA